MGYRTGGIDESKKATSVTMNALSNAQLTADSCVTVDLFYEYLSANHAGRRRDFDYGLSRRRESPLRDECSRPISMAVDALS